MFQALLSFIKTESTEKTYASEKPVISSAIDDNRLKCD